jgi:SAM-dependent methyltransferase
MRKVTRQVAFDHAWDAERAAKIAALFDAMAETWSRDHAAPERVAPLADALDRGDVPSGLVLELGSGTGLGTEVLRDRRGGPIVALDLARDMLRHAPPEYGARVHGDASALPVAGGSVAVVVHVNALLFPAEVDRVLAPGGAVVWVNTLGEQTPIHMPVADVVEALPGAWEAVASRAGTGTWGVIRRRN